MSEHATALDRPPAASRTVLELRDITKTFGRKVVLRKLNARFAAGEMTLIGGNRGAGKTILRSIMTGQRFADSGEVAVTRPIAPPLGVPWGFGRTGMVERDLSFRAAAYGLDTWSYISAVASLLDDPNAVFKPFSMIDGATRSTILYASAYLIPSDVYVTENGPLPLSNAIKTRLEPLYEEARGRAAIIWLTSGTVMPRAYDPDHIFLLENGHLTRCPDIDTLSEAID